MNKQHKYQNESYEEIHKNSYSKPQLKIRDKNFKVTKHTKKSKRILPLLLITFIIYLIICLQPIQAEDIYLDEFTTHSECPYNGLYTKLLILITSSPENYLRRKAIRRTWGTYVSRADISILFVLGKSLKAAKAVEKEENRYRDIIIANFDDKYRYLSLKTLAMLYWVKQFCANAEYILKTDDDCFVNVPAWLYLVKLKPYMTIWGHVYYDSEPDRDIKSKYYVSNEEFPWERYPTYIWGAGYLLSRDCVEPLLEASKHIPYLSMEDVYITGVLAENVGILRRDFSSVNASVEYEHFYVHDVQANEQYALWREFLLTHRLVMETDQ